MSLLEEITVENAGRRVINPLKAIAMPSYGVLLHVTTGNSWALETPGGLVRMAYVATDSTERLSFVTVQAPAHPGQVARATCRPTRYQDMQDGVVIELALSDEIAPEERVLLLLAQAGATTYFPPQQIDDLP